MQELEADTLVPVYVDICGRDYLPEMSAFINDWISAVSDAIAKGIRMKEAKENIAFFDRYPMLPGSDSLSMKK